MILEDQPHNGQYEKALEWALGLRVAIVHDWLVGMRGGERVLEAMLSIFPRAEIYTLFYDPEAISETINRRPIHCSPLARLPGVRRYYRLSLPVLPWAIGRLRLRRSTDLVLSSSHCVAHGVRPPAGTPHATYCYSPMRYLYDMQEAYARGGSGLSARLVAPIAPALRRWDKDAARRCGAYWAISGFVAERIKRVYGIEARVIYPPARTDYFTPADSAGSAGGAEAGGVAEQMFGGEPFYLVVSALTAYKRVDLAIEAAAAAGKRLVVVGSGPLGQRLRAMAAPGVRMLGWVDDGRLRELYRACEGLIFPGVEDFGIVPIEAMACGKPVLALRGGGLAETVVEGETGTFFDSGTAESLAGAWREFDPGVYDPARIRAHAERFGERRFAGELAADLMNRFGP